MKKQRNIFRKSALDFLRSAVLPIIFTAVIMLMVISGLRQTESASNAEGLRILEDSIRRAIVINYAIEGRYPASIEYIEENFGIHIDRSRYAVHYIIHGSNLLPTIAVVPK